MNQKFTVIKKKSLIQAMQQYYDHYIVATGMYNLVLYENHFEMLERALSYHMNIMNDLNETFKLLEPLEESIDMIGLEKCIFKTRTERLALDNYYALQELRDLYKEVEQQFYTLKTASMMGDDSNDTD
nr:MAG TPA: hypothetical protein [Caudoviricetes sp.]